MPLSITAIKADQATFTYDFVLSRTLNADGVDGVENFEPVVVTYRPSAITPDFDQMVVDSIADPAKAKSMWMAEGLAQIIVSWDVVAEDGSPYPTDVKSLCGLPDFFLSDILIACIGNAGKVRADLKNG